MRSWRNGSLKAIAAVSVLFAFTLKAQDSKTEKAVSYLTENQCSEGFWNQDLQKQLVDSLESFRALHSANIARFGVKAIHSTSNSICLDPAIHQRITAYTNSGHRVITWMRGAKYAEFSTLRDYIKNLSWEDQYRWGQSICQWALKHGGDMNGFLPPSALR